MSHEQLRLELGSPEFELIERAAQVCEEVAAQSNNSLFRSGAKICAGEIRRLMEKKNADHQ